MLQPEEFSGGEAPGQANFVLRKLGFTVVRKGEAVEGEKPARPDWGEAEVRLIVADYFDDAGERNSSASPSTRPNIAAAWPRNWPGGLTPPSSSSTPTSRRS